MAPDAAATFKVVESGSGLPGPFFFYQEAMDEHANPGHVHGSSNFSTLRHARVPAERAEEFAARVAALAEEFARLGEPPESGSTGSWRASSSPTCRGCQRRAGDAGRRTSEGR